MTEKIQNKILYRANNNEISLGIRISNSTEEVIEIAGLMGLDYVYLDAQHSPFTLPEIEKYCRLSQGFGLTTMIRIPDGERTTILNYLDRGANVIQIPDLQTAKEAETFVKYTYFGPIGIRSSTRLRTVMQVQDASMDNRKNLYELIKEIEGLKSAQRHAEEKKLTKELEDMENRLKEAKKARTDSDEKINIWEKELKRRDDLEYERLVEFENSRRNDEKIRNDNIENELKLARQDME